MGTQKNHLNEMVLSNILKLVDKKILTILHSKLVVMDRYGQTFFTIRALTIIATADNLNEFFLFICFFHLQEYLSCENEALIFHLNNMLAEDTHGISSLICFKTLVFCSFKMLSSVNPSITSVIKPHW